MNATRRDQLIEACGIKLEHPHCIGRVNRLDIAVASRAASTQTPAGEADGLAGGRRNFQIDSSLNHLFKPKIKSYSSLT
jgi:hypothetical protein